MRCLFCEATREFTTAEHIVPESLGNDDLILRGQVCDKCQNYFGREVEKYVLDKSPIAFWRTFLGIDTKRGNLPSVDMSQPGRQKGRLPAVHPAHDDIAFTYHTDGSCSADINDPQIIREILDGTRTQFRTVLSPKLLHMLGRFLCKVGIELVCLENPEQARLPRFSAGRRYSRFGEFGGLWPIFHFSAGNLRDLRSYREDDAGPLQEVECYSYSLLDLAGQHVLFRFAMGTDNWVVCLDDPYPGIEIRSAFTGADLRLIWYPPDQIAPSSQGPVTPKA